METVGIFLVALAFGFLLAVLLLYSLIKGSFEARLQEGVKEGKKRATDEALNRSRATIKGQIGERFAPFSDGFGYEPADARFLGSPVDYVVFDGLADDDIREVAFVEVKVGALPLTPLQRQVQQAVNEGRVRWRVVQLPE